MGIAATVQHLARESRGAFPALHRLLPPYTELQPWPWSRPDAVPSGGIAVVRLEGTGLPYLAVAIGAAMVALSSSGILPVPGS